MDAREVCNTIANTCTHAPDTVIGPVVGGVIIAQHVGIRLTQLHGKPVMSIYAEKENGTFVIGRGYDKHVTGKRVLVVEDVLSSGESVRGVVEAVRALGGEV